MANSWQCNAPSFEITGPADEKLRIPQDADEDFAYFTPDQPAEARRYYDEEGYVVVRGLIPHQLCHASLDCFRREVKPYHGFIYRQTTTNPERHDFTSHGHMLNSVLNMQSLPSRRFPEFKSASLAILTHHAVQSLCHTLFGEPSKMVQSMFFEGNPVTRPHQDTYYLDAERIGCMVAAWFAVEDIKPGAGRFFVYPKSHRVDMAKNGGDFDVAFNHERYKQAVIDVIRIQGLACRAPALSKGDVLLWSGKTIHGSLATTQPEHSRASFTAHYIPRSMRFLQFQSRLKPLKLSTVNGMEVHKPKDLDRFVPQTIFAMETTFPSSFQTAKKLAIKLVTHNRHRL